MAVFMFTIDNTLTELNIREKNILKLLFSMNVHQVATPEMILEDAKSYILFFRESSGMISAYIALYLMVTDRRLFYVNSSNPFPERDMDAIEEESLEFAEGLGAMLDEKDFTMMTMEDKKIWIDAQEIFNPKAEPAPAPTPSAPEEAQAAPEPPAPASTPPTPVQETSKERISVTPAQAAPEPPAPELTLPTPSFQEISKEPATVTPAQTAPAPPAPAPNPTQTTPPPVPPVREASKEPVIVPPPVRETAPAQQTQPVQQAPAQPVPQTQPASAAAPASEESAEPVSSPEPSDLHEQKIQNRNAAAASRYAVSSAEAARKRQEILQKAIREGIAKPPKKALRGSAASSTGVVSRDREALARLLTSF